MSHHMDHTGGPFNNMSLLLIRFYIMWITCIQVVTAFYKIPMYYHDSRNWDVKSSKDADLDFDVLVGLAVYIRPKGTRKAIYDTYTTGVIIDEHRILTSFNPFRWISQKFETLRKFRASFLRGRSIYLVYWPPYQNIVKEKKVFNVWNDHYIICGRQVVTVPDDYMLTMNYTGNDHNSPLHDLMVIRVAGKLNSDDIHNPSKADQRTIEDSFWPDNYYENKTKYFPKQRMKIADANSQMSGEIKIGTLQSYYRYLIKHNITHRQLKVLKFKQESKVDCERYIPREWGHFICIENNDKHLGIHSGGILVSNNLIFGLNSFTLVKGRDSIFAFTDVRKYKDEIGYVCNSDR